MKKSIKLDSKLNTSDADFYGGFTYTGEPLPEEGLDFVFYWDDIPSYITIDHKGISLEVNSMEDTFQENAFREVI